jgi:adenylate cyclase
VAAGPVVAQDGDFFGRTVNLAARLASRASTAQTLVTKEVVDLSPERGFGFREIGSVELRGFAEPVAAFEASAET